MPHRRELVELSLWPGPHLIVSLCAVELVITEGGGSNREQSTGRHSARQLSPLSVSLLRHRGQNMMLRDCRADHRSCENDKMATRVMMTAITMTDAFCNASIHAFTDAFTNIFPLVVCVPPRICTNVCDGNMKNFVPRVHFRKTATPAGYI